MRDRAKINVIVSALFLTVIIGVGILFIPPFSYNAAAEEQTEGGEEMKVAEQESPIHLKISCVGDIMAHSPQLKAANIGGGEYSFEENYTYVKGYIESADVAFCNVETTFLGRNYTGYPLFSAPDSLARAIRDAGFDVAITSNNHMMDTGGEGLLRSIEVLRSTGMVTVGSQYDGEASGNLINVKGITIGAVSYTYETTGSADGSMTVNGNPVPSEYQDNLCSFNYHDLDNDMAAVSESVRRLRGKGAQLIVCYMHWGEEYQRSPNDYQKQITKRLCDIGVDIIFASHPHVLQGIEVVTGAAIGHDVPVFYSMGNFISNQRSETLNNRYTEQGMIATVELDIMKSTGKVTSIMASTMPTWVDKTGHTGKTEYYIIPLDEYVDYNPVLLASGHLGRAQQALSDCKELLGDYVWAVPKPSYVQADSASGGSVSGDSGSSVSDANDETGLDGRPYEDGYIVSAD